MMIVRRVRLSRITLRACFFLCASLSVSLPPLSGVALGQSKPFALSKLDKPFLFSYGSWEKRVRITNGVAYLSGDAVDAKGGAGVNEPIDLSASAQNLPAISVRVGAKNRLKTLRLMLLDDAQGSGTWEFSLPAASSKVVTLIPKDAASFSNPNSVGEKGKLNLAKVIQWQLSGSYANAETIDLEVTQLLSVRQSTDALKIREAAKAKEDEETARKNSEIEALHKRYGVISRNSPELISVSKSAPDILCLSVRAGRIIPGKIAPYVAQSGDSKKETKDGKGNLTSVVLSRGGQEIGWLIGKKRDTLVRYEIFEGDPLLTDLADDPKNYLISSEKNAQYNAPKHPLAVFRKSKPLDWSQPGKEFSMLHRIYLKTPTILTGGMTYSLKFDRVNVQKKELSFLSTPHAWLSESVHVSQIGFRPDDPVKRAFLSLWLGNGGAYRFEKGTEFEIVDEKTDQTVFRGKAMLAKGADEPEKMWKDQNFNKTDVWRLDFSPLKTPGKYHVFVPAVGRSYAFEIGESVWARALQVQMQGLYNERSGVELVPPYAAFKRPRSFHPADGAIVRQSSFSVLDKGEGEQLEKGDTGVAVPEAWGGYHDAGDWNPRRATHLRVTAAQLELAEMFPDFAQKLKLNLPPTPGMPDILTEAQFELDLFRRLQKPDGGVPCGIETNGDPYDGEVSWNQSMIAYVYAPDLWSSYVYAANAARFSLLVRNYDAKLATTYRESALRAMNFSEKAYAKMRATGTLSGLRWEAKDDRNLAALEIYRLTEDRKWNEVFLENSCLKSEAPNLFAYGDHVQKDAAFAYARLSEKLADPQIKKRAIAGLIEQSKKSLEYAGGNAFNLTTPDKGKPMMLGFFSTPDASDLIRAHFLTKEATYLEGAVQACQFQSGCNPNNMTYTTGLGSNPPLHPLHLDTRRSGQPAPVGLTVYGNVDFKQWTDEFFTWPMKYFLNAACTPSASDWPITEAYFDIFLYPATNEFTVDIWASNVLVWGYLAARK